MISKTALPNSTSIQAVSYDDETGDLVITLRKGGKYLYKGVPSIKYKELIDAESAGRYWLSNIKGHYIYIRLSK